VGVLVEPRFACCKPAQRLAERRFPAKRAPYERATSLVEYPVLWPARRAIVGNLSRFRALNSGLKKQGYLLMTVNYVTPFRVFKSFVEFYPKLGAMIAFGTMAAAARMIPTSGAAISDPPQIAKGPEVVSPANNSSPRKRSPARKTPRKTSKRATGRRKAA